MFLGDAPLTFVVEIVIRTSVMYLYTLVLVRTMGKRGRGQLSPFEMVIIVALGSAVGDPMLYDDVPLLHGMAVVTVVVALERLLVVVTQRSRRLERLIESTPVLLVKDGAIDEEVMNKEELSEAELFMSLREARIEQLGEVRLAYLEPNGKISVFRSEEQKSGRSVLPPG